MPHERRPDPPRSIVDGIEGRDTLYEVELWASPSRHWRAAFLHPSPNLVRKGSTPDAGRLYLHGATLYFRTAPRYLDGWLRRIDRWIAYANSIVEE
jgi:hypothetical protein